MHLTKALGCHDALPMMAMHQMRYLPFRIGWLECRVNGRTSLIGEGAAWGEGTTNLVFAGGRRPTGHSSG